jgi:CBS domain-containing protein
MALLARDIMQTRVVTVPSDMPLSDVADLLFRERIGGAPVIEAGAGGRGRVIGIISRTDLMRFPLYRNAVAGVIDDYVRDLAAADGIGGVEPLPAPVLEELSAHAAGDAMAASPISFEAATPVRDVARAMVARRVHRVVITDGDALAGVISSLDIVRLVAEGRDLGDRGPH